MNEWNLRTKMGQLLVRKGEEEVGGLNHGWEEREDQVCIVEFEVQEKLIMKFN